MGLHDWTQISTEFGQRIRLHLLFCELHKDSENIHSFFIKDQPKVDYYKERPAQIYKELQYSKYLQYTTILIMIQSKCKCGTLILRKVLRNLKLNRHLRNKTKLVFSGYQHQYPMDSYSYIRSTAEGQSILSSGSDNSSGTERLRERANDKRNEIIELLPTDMVLRDIDIFKNANLDNMIFVQDTFQHQVSFELYFQICVFIKNYFISLNELFVTDRFSFKSAVTHSTARADLYFFNINPALAIIINNYYFTNTEGVREGSEQDVRRLMRELKIAQIPFVLIQDSGREQLLQILYYIRGKNFHPVKSFLFFIMSHGGANNVINTIDGKLDLIEDIVQPIESNKSLKEANKFIIVISCRGSIDMEYADRNDLKKIRNANITYTLDDKTVILRSVPELVMSPRDPKWGTPFMRSFCHSFRRIDHTQDIRIVHNRIEEDLQNEPYYEYLKKCSDLIVGNDKSSHCIIQPHIETLQMLKLIKSIRYDNSLFQGRDLMRNDYRSLFYVCGSVKEIDDPSLKSFANIYFSPQLDEDKDPFPVRELTNIKDNEE